MKRTFKQRKPGKPAVHREKKPGRNEPCHCGSGKKYKHCHEPRERISLQKKIIQENEEKRKKNKPIS